MSESTMRVPAEREILSMSCRCCGEQTVRLVIDLGDQPLCNRLVKPDTPIGSEPIYPLRLGYCETCTMMQIDHTIPRDDMFRDYVYVSGTTQTLARHFAATTERLAAAYDVKLSDRIVDIGSNDGTWLRNWKGRAYGIGVEPAIEIAEKANQAGVYTINDYFDLTTASKIAMDFGKAKLITSAGSFFHMEDLHGAVDGVKALLADDGVFVCQAISGADMIHGNAFDQVLHEHLLYYTARSFGDLMSRHGLELFKVVHHPIHGGTNEYHVGHHGVHPIEVHNLAAVEGVSFADCAAFAQRVIVMRDALIPVLERYREMGKSVWAYGAPGKGATLLNSFGIGRDLVQYAVEKNPLKFGVDIPGCRISIIREGRTHPDAYLVLAWNFLAEFIDKERAFLADGGEFIVPVPDVRIVGAEVLKAAAD